MALTRRWFLGGAAIGAAALALPFAVRALDRRVSALIDRSRDAHGRPHVDRAAFADGDAAIGTLPVSPGELRALRAAITGNETRVRVAGSAYVVVRRDRDAGGAYLHAVARGGAFVTVRDRVIATSAPGMAHGRALHAVYQEVAS